MALRIVIGDVTIGIQGQDFSYIFSVGCGGMESLYKDGKEWLYRSPRPAFWRATTDNDRGNGFVFRSAVWSAADRFVRCVKVTARINDILHITWGDVYCGERRRFYTHLLITEKKTGKETRILINKELQETLLSYRTTQPSIADTDYLFPSPRKTGSPLSRYQAYRIVRKAAEAVGIEDVIRCHSLRKTFGYHAWKMGTPPALLMEIYNHSSFQITKHYLGIEQDDKDAVFRDIQL